MLHRLLTTSAIVVAAALAITAGPAKATPILGTDSIGFGETIPYTAGGSPTTDLFNASTVVFTPGEINWLHGGNNFSSITYNTPTSSSVLNLADPIGFTIGDSTSGIFTSEPSIVISGTTYYTGTITTPNPVNTGSESMALYLVGNFVTAGDTAGFGSNTMTMTITIGETCNGKCSPTNIGTFNTELTLAAPGNAPSGPVTPTPEPASMAMLGVALLGIGAARRRKA